MIKSADNSRMEFVILRELAIELGYKYHRNLIAKSIKKGIYNLLIRVPDPTTGRLVLAVPEKHLDIFRQKCGRTRVKEEDTENTSKQTFYIIQLFPEDAPQIIKMGQTSKTAEQRSKRFHTWNPIVLREQPIEVADERTLIKMIGKASGAKQIGEEMFVVKDLPAFLERADQVFQFLPQMESV